MGICKKVINIFLVSFAVAVLSGIYVWLKHPFLQTGKYAHISIDDVTICFQNLTRDSVLYNSIFEEPFFSYLQKLHSDYDCSFTCYIYEKDGNFNLSQMPQKYLNEFRKSNYWLKFGYHGVCPSSHTPNNVNYRQFVESYKHVNDELSRFASDSVRASILRLDYYYATIGEVEYLVDHGVKALLSADDDRRSYFLPFDKNMWLLQKNSINYGGLKYLRTNIRIENIDFPYLNLLRYRERDTLVVFTHEWKLDRINKYKLERTISILKDQNYKFICE